MPDQYLGIDIGGTTLNLGVCDRDGIVRGRLSVPTLAIEGPDDTITRILGAANTLIGQCGAVGGCGVGMPGELDIERHRFVRANHFPGWADVPIARLIGERLGVATTLENDANCAAWGEYVAGVGRGTRSLACFTLGTGVGGGVIIAGQLWLGANGAAGALGHIAVDPNGPECKCGQRGCVEVYASATSLAARYGKGSARDAFDAAARGEADAMASIDWAADGLAAGVANVIHIVQPDVVVLAGGMAAAGDALLGRVRTDVSRRVRSSWLRAIRIELSALGNDAGWIGAALWCAHQPGHSADSKQSYDLMRS
jgi:glucokinase